VVGKSSSLKKISFWLGLWGVVKAAWDAIGHIGNVQTLWDIVSGAVQYWPGILRGSVWVITSWWLPLILSGLFLLIWRLVTKESPRASVQPNPHQSAPSVEATTMPMIPTPDLSYLADPAYDEFFPTDWRKRLTKEGQHLMEQWTTQLDYPEKQRRESDSINWLSEVNQYARKNLKAEQLDEFMKRYSTAVSPAKKYEFVMALTNAGTQPGTQEHDIAFEVAGKVKLLERFRSEPAHPSLTNQKPLTRIWLRDECNKWINLGDAIIDKLKAGAAGVPDAKAWIKGVETFSRINMSVADYDRINTDPSIETFHQERLKLDPSYEPKMYKSIVAQRGAKLIQFRDKIK
jgi:hypothetical protein